MLQQGGPDYSGSGKGWRKRYYLGSFNKRSRWISRKDDILPKKITIPAKTGPRAGRAPIPHDKALDEYYKLRKWTADGIPTEESLQEAGLAEYICLLKINYKLK